MKLKDAHPGDIILSRSGTWLSKAIRFVTALQTGSSEYSHASMATGDGLCIEALWEITISDIKKYEGQQIQVWRIHLSERDRRNIVHGMYQLAGQNYGIMKLPLFAMDAIATQIGKLFGAKNPCYWFTAKFGITNLPVCSQLVVYSLHKFTSYRLLDEQSREINWKTVSPDRLQDLLKHPQNKAKIVYEHN